MLEPRIRRRVDWESVMPENSIQRCVFPPTWTRLIHVLCEIVDGSQRVDDAFPDEGAIMIRSVNSEWEVLATARIVCEQISPQSGEDLEMDNNTVPNTTSTSEIPSEPVGMVCPLHSRKA